MRVIFDAGCGLGYKAAWFAELAPKSLVIGMDYSRAAEQAAIQYRNNHNLYFIQGDIANTGFKTGSISFISCDQVIMHTKTPNVRFTSFQEYVERMKVRSLVIFMLKSTAT